MYTPPPIMRTDMMVNRTIDPKTISGRIVKIAESYIGKTEKPNNGGFTDPDFERRMRLIGFHTGDAWCADFGKLVWNEAYASHPDIVTIFNHLFTPSAIATLANFKNSKHFTISNVPTLGALAIWRHGDGWQGHMGIVCAFDLAQKRFVTTEGNTNSNGSREGTTVLQKPRTLELPFNPNGLNLQGFVYPPELPSMT